MGTCSTNVNFNCCIPDSAENISFCLDIPLVLRKIFQHFSNEELRQLSLVDKQWKCEARSLLAKRGSLIAKLRPYSLHMVNALTWPRHDLAALATDLRRMNPASISFCGINVKIGSSKFYAGSNTPPGNLDPTYDIIVERIKWRNLSVTLGRDWQHKNNCQGFLLVKKILQDKCRDLVEIVLTAECNLGEQPVKELLQDCSFPRLKALEIICWSDTFDLNFVRALVSRAPKLEKLHAADPLLSGNVLEGSSAAIVPIWEFKPLEEFCPSLLNALRPESLSVMATSQYSKMRDMDRFNEIMPVVLKNSWNTLNFLRMELFFAFPLMNCGVSFVNMSFLTICIPDKLYNSPQPAILEYAKALDFTRIFPYLQKVCITSGYSYDISVDEVHEFAKKGSDVMLDPKTSQAANIKHLKFGGSSRHDKVRFLAQMFPNIQTLKVEDCYGADIPYELIWEHWVNLKRLEVSVLLVKIIKNLDSVFCGIHPEEVAQLSEKDDEYLSAVNIVPVMPAITCLKELRGLDLKFSFLKRTDDGPSVFSKVTYFIAFKKFSNLSVTVTA